jgi:hypothetical protein
MQTRFQLREDSKERFPRPRFHSSLQTVAYAVTDILRICLEWVNLLCSMRDILSNRVGVSTKL